MTIIPHLPSSLLAHCDTQGDFTHTYRFVPSPYTPSSLEELIHLSPVPFFLSLSLLSPALGLLKHFIYFPPSSLMPAISEFPFCYTLPLEHGHSIRGPSPSPLSVNFHYLCTIWSHSPFGAVWRWEPVPARFNIMALLFSASTFPSLLSSYTHLCLSVPFSWDTHAFLSSYLPLSTTCYAHLPATPASSMDCTLHGTGRDTTLPFLAALPVSSPVSVVLFFLTCHLPLSCTPAHTTLCPTACTPASHTPHLHTSAHLSLLYTCISTFSIYLFSLLPAFIPGTSFPSHTWVCFAFPHLSLTTTILRTPFSHTPVFISSSLLCLPHMPLPAHLFLCLSLSPSCHMQDLVHTHCTQEPAATHTSFCLSVLLIIPFLPTSLCLYTPTSHYFSSVCLGLEVLSACLPSHLPTTTYFSPLFDLLCLPTSVTLPGPHMLPFAGLHMPHLLSTFLHTPPIYIYTILWDLELFSGHCTLPYMLSAASLPGVSYACCLSHYIPSHGRDILFLMIHHTYHILYLFLMPLHSHSPTSCLHTCLCDCTALHTAPSLLPSLSACGTPPLPHNTRLLPVISPLSGCVSCVSLLHSFFFTHNMRLCLFLFYIWPRTGTGHFSFSVFLLCHVIPLDGFGLDAF